MPPTRTARKPPSRLKNRETESEKRRAASGERVPEKNSRLACEGTSVNDRYEVGTAKKAIIPSPRCAGVSRFGYYSGRDRPGSITKVRRQELRIMIKDVFEDS